MPDTIKNIYLKKKIDGAIVTIYPHSDAGIISYTKGSGQDAVSTTVAEELASLASSLAGVSSEQEIKSWIATAKSEILGSGEINQAYDTLKEVADYLSGDNSGAGAAASLAQLLDEVEDENDGLLARMTAAETAISGINTTIGADDTSGLRLRIKNAEDDIDANETSISGINAAIGTDSTSGTINGRITALETTVGDANSGLVKGVADNASDITALETTVGDSTSGLVKDVADIQTDIGDDNTAASVKGRITALESYTQVIMTSTNPTALTADDNTLYIVYDKEEILDDPTI